MQDPSPAQLRKSAAIRVLAAVAIAGGLTVLAILASWEPLDLKTDVVGYPIYANFNGYNYFTLFYLAVVFFPIAALLLFLGLTRLGPRIGLPSPPSRGPLRPGTTQLPQPVLDGDPPLSASPPARRRAVVAARVAFVGAVLGFEAGITTDSVWLWLLLCTAIYALVVVLGAAALGRRGPWNWPFESRVAAVNAIGIPLTVAGLFLVSSNTEVLVATDGTVHHYEWFPGWLAMLAAAGLVAWIANRLRRAGSSASAIATERCGLLLMAAPVCLFLLVASIPGDIGTIDSFDGGQAIVGSRLVEDGWFPWRDVVLAHGLLLDAFNPMITLGVFGDSYWGQVAGNSMLLSPLYYICMYFLFVYLFGRNWSFLLLGVLVVLGTVFAPADVRFVLWPLILLLLAAVLNRPTRLRAAGLGLLAAVQAVVTPEAAPALLAIGVVLVVYELYHRRPGTNIVSSFPRTIWYTGAGIVFAAAFAAFLATRGALDDYVYLAINLVRGRTIDGALPPGPNPGTLSQTEFDFLALAPPAALLIFFAFAAAKVRLRQQFDVADWVIAAVALFEFLYYPKFLSRMDTGHVLEPFAVAMPLMLFIVYRAVTAAEQVIRRGWSGNPVFRLTSHPVTLGLVVLLAALTWGILRDRVADAPARYHALAVEEPRVERVGYAAGFDAAAYHDIKRVIDAYLQPEDRLFDLTNEPAVFFYFMKRYPSTRYFVSASLTDTSELQGDVIDRLKSAPPKLIVFDNTSPTLTGLSNMDGVPNNVRLYKISQWILDRYRPLLTTHDHTIYARRDMPPASRLGLHLAEQPVTRGVPFRAQPCVWGYAPNFLSSAVLPSTAATSVSARVTEVQHPQATVLGWAGDQQTGEPAVEVIASVGGRIVGRATPLIERPDLPAGGWPAGFARAGFRVQVPVGLRNSKQLHVFGVARDGSTSELPSETSAPSRGTINLGGDTILLDPDAVAGHLDTTLGPPSVQIDLPAGTRWSDFRWLEIEAGKDGFQNGAFALFDRLGRPAFGREISFQTLDRAPDRYVVPVGSCPQWHGYESRHLFLAIHPGQDIAAVRLIR